MRKVMICLCIVAVLTFCIVQLLHADELSELKEKTQTMQKQIGEMQKKIEVLETEREKALPKAAEERLTSLEEKISKKAAAWTDKIRLTGNLWEYYISQDSSYFGKTSSYVLETTAKVGVEAKLSDDITANIRLCAQNAAGDAGDYSGVTSDDWVVEPDLANIEHRNLLGLPLSVTLGRQNLFYGDGFLICDGYTDSRAVWTNPITSFYALKAAYEKGPLKLEGFAAMADKDFKSYESYLTDATARTGKRNVFGANLHFEKEKSGIWDLGVFYKDDDSNLHSNTLAISQRGSRSFDLWPESRILPQLTLEGEIVEEFGKTKVKDHALTTSRYDREAFGGHFDTKLSFTKLPFSPYLLGSYIYLPGDNPHTDKNECFDPMFYGFCDLGKWFLGDINSWSLTNYNERVGKFELGISPTEKTRLRGLYYYVTLDRQITVNAGKRWSHEVNIQFDYYPNDWSFYGVLLGYAHPLKAARAYAGDNQDTTEYLIWAGVNF